MGKDREGEGRVRETASVVSGVLWCEASTECGRLPVLGWCTELTCLQVPGCANVVVREVRPDAAAAADQQ